MLSLDQHEKIRTATKTLKFRSMKSPLTEWHMKKETFCLTMETLRGLFTALGQSKSYATRH